MLHYLFSEVERSYSFFEKDMKGKKFFDVQGLKFGEFHPKVLLYVGAHAVGVESTRAFFL